MSEIFAVEVAGWKAIKHGLYWHDKLKRSGIQRGGELHRIRDEMRLHSGNTVLMPDYALSVDAVLPYFEAMPGRSIMQRLGGYEVYCSEQCGRQGRCSDESLAYCLCYAILQAKGLIK